MITINQPKVLSQTQTYKFAQVKIETSSDGLMAVVWFNLYGDNDEHLGQENIVYTGDDFNKFWAGFTSGKFLYDQLVEKKALEVVVPNAIEDEFKNAPVEPDQK